ncbi:MAG TPA: lipopolysaccharide assembly protein LapA domain-containing protein [Acidimicrobiia bacterium]|nr:lipopolysaccharide assembly protein LapA domain-containing protein [Acidimicrobiia bacterium]
MDENQHHEVDDLLEPEQPKRVKDPGEGVPWGVIVLLIWAVALIIFSVQNAEQAIVQFLAWEWQMPMALLVMITALATVILSALTWPLYRRRRRKHRMAARSAQSED